MKPCFDIIIFGVYDYSDFDTRIILNKLMRLSYKTKNPLKNIFKIHDVVSNKYCANLDLGLYKIYINFHQKNMSIYKGQVVQHSCSWNNNDVFKRCNIKNKWCKFNKSKFYWIKDENYDLECFF